MAQAAKEKGKPPLSSRIIPCDVTTRWNYTYKMLSFAYVYREAYNQVTANKDMKIRKYELSQKEWKIVKDLADVLKVSYMFVDFNYLTMMLTILQIFKDATLFFCAQLPALQRLFQRWTTSINTSPLPASMQNTIRQLKQLLPSGSNF